MTVNPSIDPARLLEEQLAQASPDLLRELLTTFINTLMSAEADAVCGAELRRQSARSGPTAATATGTGTSTPAPAPWTWRSPSCATGSYFPEWLLERRKRAERALTSGGGDLLPARGLAPGGWTSWSQSLGITAAVEVAGLGDGQGPRRPRRGVPHPPLERRRPVHVRGRRRPGAQGPRGRPGGRRCTPWSPPASTPTGTARSSASRSPPARTAPAGWGSSAT